MVEGEFDVAFPLKHAQKDLRFALQLADDCAVPLAVTAAANAHYLAARDEHGDEDFSAVIKVI